MRLPKPPLPYFSNGCNNHGIQKSQAARPERGVRPRPSMMSLERQSSSLGRNPSSRRRALSKVEEEGAIWDSTAEDVEEDMLVSLIEEGPRESALSLPKHNARAEVRLIVGFVVFLVIMMAILLRHTDTTSRRAIGQFGQIDRAFVLSTRGTNGTTSPEMD